MHVDVVQTSKFRCDGLAHPYHLGGGWTTEKKNPAINRDKGKLLIGNIQLNRDPTVHSSSCIGKSGTTTRFVLKARDHNLVCGVQNECRQLLGVCYVLFYC